MKNFYALCLCIVLAPVAAWAAWIRSAMASRSASVCSHGSQVGESEWISTVGYRWPNPANSRWPEFTTTLDQVFGPIWTGAVEFDAGLKNASAKLQEVLDKPKS